MPSRPHEIIHSGTAVANFHDERDILLRDGREYKAALADQGRPDDVVRELRLARLPHYVWVIEAHDRALRDAGKPSVVAEVVFDPNSSDHKHRPPRRDALSMPGFTMISPPDQGDYVPIRHTEQPWQSHLLVGA